MHRSAVDLSLAAESIAARLRDTHPQRRLEFAIRPGLTAFGDARLLEIALTNLLDNAVKFNRPNGDVYVETTSSDGVAQITISDSGIGIPSEDLPRVFERFYRVDKARSREMGGTGLGLSIVKHVIEQMGGTVTVASSVGEGSRFTITVPQFLGSLVP